MYPSKLEEFYNITSIIDFEEVFNIIAKKKGLLQKGGIPNYDRVIDLIINDIKSGKKYTLIKKENNNQVDGSIVKEKNNSIDQLIDLVGNNIIEYK